MIVTSSLVVNCESLAVSRSTYVPGAVNVAVVIGRFAFANVTAAGPLTKLQVVVTTLVGKPSSVTVPLRDAGLGNVIV